MDRLKLNVHRRQNNLEHSWDSNQKWAWPWEQSRRETLIRNVHDLKSRVAEKSHDPESGIAEKSAQDSQSVRITSGPCLFQLSRLLGHQSSIRIWRFILALWEFSPSLFVLFVCFIHTITVTAWTLKWKWKLHRSQDCCDYRFSRICLENEKDH